MSSSGRNKRFKHLKPVFESYIDKQGNETAIYPVFIMYKCLIQRSACFSLS